MSPFGSSVLPVLIKTTASLLARAVFNALLFATKSPPWDMAMIAVNPLYGVIFLTSDEYALSWSPVEEATVAPEGAAGVVKVSRVDLVILEERARKDKADLVVLEVTPGQGVEYRGVDEEVNLFFPDVYLEGEYARSWDDRTLDVMHELVEERRVATDTRRVILSTDYLGKARQLKKDKNIGADIWIGKPDEPVLIKAGATRIIIEPIDQARHEEAFGEDVTW